MRAGNLATGLRRRRRGDAMAHYDRLPAALRGWLAGAALPWSAASALRLWQRFRRETGGDVAAMLARMDARERQMLVRDALAVEGRSGRGRR